MAHGLVAPDRFTGSLTVCEVASYVASGLVAARPGLEVRTVPVDRLPHRQAVHYLRGLLVHTGALPEREEHLEWIAALVDRLLCLPGLDEGGREQRGKVFTVRLP